MTEPITASESSATAPESAAPESAAHESAAPESAAPYDALLICSFGGPNTAEDVLPFLRNVVRGKGIPEERLTAVGEHYFAFGGKSPLNEQNIALRSALEKELRGRGILLPVLWGNRNWHPYTVDTLRDAHAFGARRILVIITSAYASYSGSRQYREHLALARDELTAELGQSGTDRPVIEIDVLRPFFNEPGFVDANLEAIIRAIEELPGGGASGRVHIAYATHSIPTTMQQASAETGPSYLEQHEDLRKVLDSGLADRGHHVTSSLSYCSRSGHPSTPWLEPDINDHLRDLAAQGVGQVVVSPIGFVSDHMEVVWDLDTEALRTAQEAGLAATRAATAGVAPRFVSGLVDLITERAARERGESPRVEVRGELGAFPDVAPPGSCRMRHGEVTSIPVLAGEID